MAPSIPLVTAAAWGRPTSWSLRPAERPRRGRPATGPVGRQFRHRDEAVGPRLAVDDGVVGRGLDALADIAGELGEIQADQVGEGVRAGSSQWLGGVIGGCDARRDPPEPGDQTERELGPVGQVGGPALDAVIGVLEGGLNSVGQRGDVVDRGREAC